jgi:hypothetical protein
MLFTCVRICGPTLYKIHPVLTCNYKVVTFVVVVAAPVTSIISAIRAHIVSEGFAGRGPFASVMQGGHAVVCVGKNHA